jgi:hypothetical protein
MLAALAVVTESMPTISPSAIAATSALNLMLPLQPAHAGLRVDLGAVISARSAKTGIASRALLH